LVWKLVDQREAEGGVAWDEKILAAHRALEPVRHTARHGRRSMKPASPEPEPEDDEYPEVYDPPPPSKMAPAREKPEAPARVRRKCLATVTAAYMPKFKREDDTFKQKAVAYSRDTGFGVEKVRRLHREFTQFAKRSNDPDVEPELDLLTYGKLMAKYGVSDKKMMLRLFQIHDKDRSGAIAFREYIGTLAVFLSENREVQAKALFSMCDVDGDRRLGKLELLQFINQGVSKDKRVVVSAILDELLALMGIESVGEITYTDFVEAVVVEDEVWELFRALSPFTRMIAERGGELALQRAIT